jgi:archaetidylinositol phosphate synthase
VRREERPRYGYYVDHVVDLAGAASILIGIAASGLMSPSIAFALLAAYFMVAAESFLGTHARGVFRMAFAGFGPTELRIALAIGAVRVARDPWIGVGDVEMRLLDVAGAIGIAGLVLAFAWSAVRNTVALFRAEPRPPRRMSRCESSIERRSRSSAPSRTWRGRASTSPTATETP